MAMGMELVVEEPRKRTEWTEWTEWTQGTTGTTTNEIKMKI